MQKVAIVTGSSSGLGQSVCDLLASKNFRVFGWDLKLTLVNSPNFTFQQVDVTNSSSISSALTQILASNPKIDVLVNAAGIALLSFTITKTSVHPLDVFEKVIKTNLIGTFDVSRQVSKHMNKGVIILVGSIDAYQGSKLHSAYSASKGAVASMAMPMSRDLAYKGVRVVSINPGAFDTPMTQPIHDKIKQKTYSAISSGRFGRPEEFAHTVLFAIENQYLNGCNLELNGGFLVPNL